MIAGDGPPPSLILEYIRWLPPGSACEAIKNDAEDMLGWDISARILANVSDWAQATMIVSAQWKKKAPELQREVRPWVEAKKRKQKAEGISLARLHSILSAKAARQGG